MNFFPQGIRGLADSKWQGAAGSAYRLVGVDYRSTPGLIKVHQKLTKHSGSTIDELCKHRVACSDGSNLWFSSESGKIWRESGGTYSLLHTTTSEVSKTVDFLSSSLSGGQSFNNEVVEAAQSFTGRAGSLYKASLRLRLSSGTAVGTMVAKLYAHSGTFGDGGIPTGSVLATSDTFDPTTLTSSYQEITFTFTGANQYTLVENTKYFIAVRYVRDASENVQVEAVGNLHNGNTALLNPSGSTWTAQSTDYNFSVGILPQQTCLGAEEHDEYIYWATETALHRMTVESLAGTPTVSEDWGSFTIQDSDYHPMVRQNLELYIGDGTVIAKVDSTGAFVAATDFTVKAPERIQTLIDFDIDILVGTKLVTKGRVLRWDTVSESWSAEDVVEENGVNAFIRDDNFVYISAGDFGRLYYYNGEQMVPYQRIPGEWTPTQTGIIHQSAVGFLLGVPVFGLSNTTGNPALQGVYGFGSYSKDYPKSLSLDYPLSSGQFSGVTIGAIIVRGGDLYVAWKDGTGAGVDKLDYTAKYASAYLETTMLTPLEVRGQYKTTSRFFADYAALSTDTSVTFSYKKKHEASYTALTSTNDTKLMQVRAQSAVSEVASLQVRADFTVSSNDGPEIENMGVTFTSLIK